MSSFEFYVQIEDSYGRKLGIGVLESVSQWRYTARFDRAGTIEFTYLASDPQAQYVSNRRIARAFAYLEGAWTEVGAGVIDTVDTVPGSDGLVTMRAGGLDLLRELSYRTVGKLKIGEGSGVSHSSAVASLETYAPTGWTFIPAGAPANNYIYARFDGESVLGAAVMVADKTQTHFYRGANRTLYFVSEWQASGIRALDRLGSIAADTCAISSLTRQVDTHDLLTRIYPFGAGQGEARLTLAASTRTASSGYSLDKVNNYIEKSAAVATYGQVDFPQVEFKEIAPISNTNADLAAAANMLYDVALRELARRSTLAEQETYRLSVEGCNALLRPLQTLRLVYRDLDQGLSIDDELYILETTWVMTAQGISTTALVVSTDDRWPDTDESAAANRAVQGKVFQAMAQLGPNSYWENGTLFVGSDQVSHIAEFPFVLGPEVTTVQGVVLRYSVQSPIAFTTTVAASSTSSSASSETTSTGGSSHSHTVTISSHTHPIPNHQHATTVAGGSAGTVFGLSLPGGGVAFLTKAAAGDVVLNTNVASGAATASSGGSATPTSSSDAAHTHGIDHTHEVTPTISTAYGVYRADDSRVYALDELEYRVNGAVDWVGLDTGTDVGNDYYEFDLTADVSDPLTFRPNQENNLIEIRRVSGAGQIAISSSGGFTDYVGISTTPTEHGLSVAEVVIITGTDYHDGVWTVIEIPNEFSFYVNMTGNTDFGTGGTLEINKSAMILAKLGVRTTIQAISYG